MQLVNTHELVGAALDYAVAIALGYVLHPTDRVWHTPHGAKILVCDFMPSFYSHQGLKIIEREGISVRPIRKEGHSMNGLWLAHFDKGNTGRIVNWVEFLCGDKGKREFWRGSTLLEAAMRAFVGYNLGATIELPEGFANETTLSTTDTD